MKKTTLKFTLLLLLLALISCQTNKNRENKIKRNGELKSIEVDLDNLEQISLSEIYDTINLIPLQTGPEYILDNILKLEVHEGNFYIQTSTSLTVFNHEGKFLKSFKAQGKGPGEYITLSDFHVNDDETVELYDSKGEKIIKYDSKGNFLEEFDVGLNGYSFSKLSDKNYAIYIGSSTFTSNFKLNILDNTGEIFKRYISIGDNEAQFMHFGDLTNFQDSKNGTSFLYSFNDTIYNITSQGEVSPRIYVDFGEDKLPSKYLNKNYGNVMEFLEPLKKTNYAYRVIGFFETEKAITFGFMHKGKIPNVYYSTKEQKTYVVDEINYDMVLPGLNVEASIHTIPMASDENKFYSIINANTLIKNVDYLRSEMSATEWEKYSNNNKEVISIYRKIDLLNNPIIMEGKIKL